MKKMLSLVLALALLLSVMALPASAETVKEVNGGEPCTIRIAWWGNQTRNDLTTKVLDMYHELHPNVTFETEPTSWDGYWDKLATQAATSSMPDIFQQDYGKVGSFFAQNLMMDLTPYVENGTIDTSRISTAVLESGSMDGKLYALCLGLNSPCLFYDKETFAAAGIEAPLQLTWDQFFSISKEICEKTGVQTYIDSMVLGMLFRGIGTSEYAADGTKFGVEDDTVFKTYFQMIADAAKEPWHVSPELLVEKNPTVTETMPIIDKTTWDSFSNSNQLTTISSTAGRELGMMMWPVMADDTTQVQYLKSSQFFCGSATTKYPDVVADFINFFVTSVDANLVLKGERGVPVDSAVLAALSEGLNEIDQIMYSFIDEVNKVATPMDRPTPNGSTQIGTLVEDLTEQVRYGEISPEDAAAQVFVEGSEILAENAQ